MQIVKVKIDKRTKYAIIVLVLVVLCLEFLWPFIWQNVSILGPIINYRKLVTILLFIIPTVILLDKEKLTTIGLTIGNWRKTLLTTVLVTLAAFIVVYLTVIFWKHLDQVRVEGEQIYFIGMRFPYKQIMPSILYLMLVDQVLTVALPKEIIYRGYFQSRLSFSWKPFIAILGSTIVFALVHADRPMMLPHLLIMGPIYGYAFHYCKSIYPTVIAHCLSNIGSLLIIKHVALA